MSAELMARWEPGAVALGWTLLDFLWQGVIIGCLYALGRGLLRAPRRRLFAGHVTLLALALAPMATLLGHLQGSTPPPALQAAGGAVVSAMQATASGSGIEADTWLLWLVGAWLVGVLLLSARLWNEWRRLHQLCATSVPVAPEWQQRFDRLAHRLGVHMKVRLRQGAGIVTPMLVGVLRPTVLLPASLVARLPADQLELVLVHELAHLRRLDPLFNLLQTGLDTLLFYHPAVHWISRKVREDRELCCDDVVVHSGGDRLRYARALLALAEARAHGLPNAALAASGGALLERVERIVELPEPRVSNSQSLVALGLLGVLSLAWWVPREQQVALFEALPVALVPGAGRALPAAHGVNIADLATQLAPIDTAFVPNAAEAESASIMAADAVPVPALPETRSLLDARPFIANTPSAVSAPVASATAASDTPHIAAALPLADHAPSLVPRTQAQLGSGVSPSSGVDIAANTGPEPTRRVAPDYPRAARLRGVEGWAVLDYRIDAAGKVVDVQVREAQPAGAFDLAARRALERWRYPVGAASAGTLTQRFDFVLAEGHRQDEDERCRRQTGSRVCRPVRDLLPGSSVSLSLN